MKIFETKRLIAETYKTSDLEELYLILSDNKTMRFWPQPFCQQKVEDWIKRSEESQKNKNYGRWALRLKATGTLLGDAGFFYAQLDGIWEHDLGYIIHYPFWGQGYATEAAIACRDYAFSKLGLERICANMAADHKGSERVAQKIGMQLEKTFINTKNRNLPTQLYSIEKELWSKI